MTKTKIAFAGVMGAILMSVGANAATTSVATKGYVDQLVKGVQTSVDNLGDTYATPSSVANAINNAVTDLNLGGTYQTLANKVDAISSSMSEEEQKTQYPSVKAVLDAMPTLTEADKQAIANLTGDNGLITRVGKVETSVATLTGSGEGSVTKSIVDAISTHASEADRKYQAKSTADLQIGTTGGVFRDMTDDEKAALSSKITAEKVTSYDTTKTTVDNLTKEGGTIANLQTVVGNEEAGLVADVKANAANIKTNTANIATNTANISGINANIGEGFSATNTVASVLNTKVTIPESCAMGAEACVPMLRGNAVTWTPLTIPVDDPQQSGTPSGTPSEAIGG